MPSAARSAVLVAVTGLVLAGCNRPTWDTPLEAYQSFARSVQKGEFKVAWDALSSESRKKLEERARAISAASGESIPADARALFFASSAQPPSIKEIKVVKQEGDEALLAVTPDDGAPREVRMVREAGGWKLDVSESLED